MTPNGCAQSKLEFPDKTRPTIEDALVIKQQGLLAGLSEFSRKRHSMHRENSDGNYGTALAAMLQCINRICTASCLLGRRLYQRTRGKPQQRELEEIYRNFRTNLNSVEANGSMLRWPFSYIRRMDLIQRSNITVSLYVMLPASNSGPTADKKALGLDGFPNKAPNCLLGPGRSGLGFG